MISGNPGPAGFPEPLRAGADLAALGRVLAPSAPGGMHPDPAGVGGGGAPPTEPLRAGADLAPLGRVFAPSAPGGNPGPAGVGR